MDSIKTLFLSSYPPEECGPAAFTKDLADALDVAARAPVSSIAAIQESQRLGYGDPRVVHIIDNHQKDAYVRAAEVANSGQFDVVSVQHDVGLYSGECGVDILDFMLSCGKPIVTTLHTLMTEPAPAPRRIIRHLALLSAGVVVMTRLAARLLVSGYEVPVARVRVIPYGAPNVTPCRSHGDDALPLRTGRIAYTYSKPMSSSNVGRAYLNLFDEVVSESATLFSCPALASKPSEPTAVGPARRNGYG